MVFSPDYFTTTFLLTSSQDLIRLTEMVRQKPVALLTGYATTGEIWPKERNIAADQSLHQELLEFNPVRITGKNPEGTHYEPGWAVHMSLESALAIAERYHQDAIYYIDEDLLWIYGSTSQEKRLPAKVGSFLSRVSVE